MGRLAPLGLSIAQGGPALLSYSLAGAGVGVALQERAGSWPGFELGLGVGLGFGLLQLVTVLGRDFLKLRREESQYQATYRLEQLHHEAALEQQREGCRTALALLEAMQSMGARLPVSIDPTGNVSVAGTFDPICPILLEQAIDSVGGMSGRPSTDEVHSLPTPAPSKGQDDLHSALPAQPSSATGRPDVLTRGSPDVQA